MSEVACMRVKITFEAGKCSFRAFFYYTSVGLRHAPINVSLSKKLCFHRSQTRTCIACVSKTRMISILLWWAASLNDRSKLKGQYTDVKSGCVTSVRPSLTPPQSQFENFSRATVPFNWTFSSTSTLFVLGCMEPCCNADYRSAVRVRIRPEINYCVAFDLKTRIRFQTRIRIRQLVCTEHCPFNKLRKSLKQVQESLL